MIRARNLHKCIKQGSEYQNHNGTQQASLADLSKVILNTSTLTHHSILHILQFAHNSESSPAQQYYNDNKCNIIEITPWDNINKSQQ